MRCKACDVMLSDVEVALQNKITQEYYDMCGDCLEVCQEALNELSDDSGIVYQGNWSTPLET